jgi:predicted  nucleic acid-binding Zn-ribbon protein
LIARTLNKNIKESSETDELKALKAEIEKYKKEIEKTQTSIDGWEKKTK